MSQTKNVGKEKGAQRLIAADNSVVQLLLEKVMAKNQFWVIISRGTLGLNNPPITA